METAPRFEDRVDRVFVGRGELLAQFGDALASEGPLKLVNIHGVTGTGKSFLMRRFAQLALSAGLKTVKVQFDGKDGEGSVPVASHLEVLRSIALGLGVPTPRFATAYLAWSLTNEFTTTKESSGLSEGVREVVKSGFAEVINFLTMASLGPGGVVVAAARAGWRFVAERVSVEPLAAFHKSPEGKEFCARLKQVSAHDIPPLLSGYLAADLQMGLPKRTGGAARALIAFDSWEQFEVNFPDRRSRWFQESQIVEFFLACRPFVQFVIAGQMPVTWLDEDPRLRDRDPLHFMPVPGLSRSEAEVYLRDRRKIHSQIWIERLLDATAEATSGEETRHHSLSLGLVADTAHELLSADSGADPGTLEVNPNDLEDLVRRFMSVREDQEPFIERLALTPRFDERAIAAAQGKAFDEFTALTDFEALFRFSFVHSPSPGWLTMHGQMRKLIRDRIARYRPDKLTLAHSSWRRHYSERGFEGLAFRHRLAVEPEAAIRDWAEELSSSHRMGEGRRLEALLEWGFEAEDERPYLRGRDAAAFSLAWAQGLRQSYLGDIQTKLAQALSLTDRALADSSDEDEGFVGSIYLERGAILMKQASLVVEDVGHDEAAVDAFARAQSAFDEGSPNWSIAIANRGRILSQWGLRTASKRRLEEGVAACRSVLSMPLGDDGNLRMEVQLAFCEALVRLGELNSDVAHHREAAEVGKAALATISPDFEPVRWFAFSTTVSLAYRGWADLAPGEREIELAISAGREALSVVNREEMPVVWASSQLKLANFLIEHARRTGNRDSAEEALAGCQQATECVTRTTEPMMWSSAHGNAAKAQRILAELDGDPTRFAESAQSYRLALEIRSREFSTFIWALGHLNLADTLRLWDLVEPSVDLLHESIEHYHAALEVFTAATVPANYEWAMEGLGLAEARLAESTKE